MATTPDCNPKLIRAAFKLPPHLCEILHALVTLPLVTQDDVRSRRAKSARSSSLKVAIFRLRKMLEPYGISVYSGTSVGYWLEPADKAKVMEYLRAVGAPSTPSTPVDQEAA